MGVIKLFSTGSISNNQINNTFNNTVIIDNFKIKRVIQFKNNCLCWINYPNCKNFKGDKILLIENMTKLRLKKLKTLDPHFLENNKIIIRFRPTLKYWKLGIKILHTL